MSSSIDSLFGAVAPQEVDSSVSKLFGSSSGPVDSILVKNKKRTVVVQVEAAEEAEEQPDGGVGEVSAAEEPLKKKPRRKRDDNTELEDRYFAKLAEVPEETQETPDSDKEEDAVEKAEVGQQAKTIDLKEDELEKAERTVFVGNLSNEAITSKKVFKEFKKLFSSDLEENEQSSLFSIENVRFRSISFDEALPRKVAFVQQKLHKARGFVNAYIVYKKKQAVNKVCSRLNGQLFRLRHLRVDSVAHPAPHENKRSVFVGNLDFEEDDESLWAHFRSCGDIEYVRVVRDSRTNMGKGFAYIQFKDFQSVNKALLLDGKTMQSVKEHGSKRKLRVSRCKNIKKNSPSSLENSKLNESHKTKFGRAKKVLGKADRATVGRELTVEGLRATKGQGHAASHLKKRKQRSKTGRVTKRSLAFKKKQASS
ncbi:hypothetical protein HG536_0F03740 [Torulaspora globosa]|uniref:Nucleolar protein 12 n=1 Tax=Torulaspora globosa TaxID=48254 RepID=A0A7G3ZKL3_9SACH|nr:uncharacterized protein HG536_0F03740 [Torulaspora globosa]QLL34049.1 hypothetical protein HG536_0F03740 [Torulaspora globosa]